MVSETRLKAVKSRSGFVLPLVVLVMVIVIILGYGILSLGLNSRIKAIRNTQDICAVEAGEACITQALRKMNDKLVSEQIWDNSTLNELAMTDVALPLTDAAFSFDITGDPIGGFTIGSTCGSGEQQRKFYATTRLRTVFEFAIIVKENLTLFPNSEVIAYNSLTGETELSTKIGTASIGEDSVIIMNGATVNGDVLVGVTGDPEVVIKSSGTITGTTDSLSMEVPFPEVTVPDGYISQGSINGSTTLTGPGDNGEYSNIDLGNGEVLEIVGPVEMHVTGDIDMKNGSEIKISDDGTSSLILYLDGNWESKEGAGINNETLTPASFMLYGTGDEGQTIDLKAKNDFYGAVYAPNASLGIKAGGDIYGSFVGTNFEMKSNSVFHYDVALCNIGINDPGVFFTIKRWWEG